MKTNSHKIKDYDLVLNTKYGKEGTPQRMQFENETKAFYASQILSQTRKKAKMTQTELTEKAGTTKLYISRIEDGLIEPGIGLFFRLINSPRLYIDISKLIG